MTITTTSLGTYTTQITTSGLNNKFSDFYSAVKSAITATGTGWTLHDEFLGNGLLTGDGTAFTAGSFVVGQTYVIASVGTTSFTSIGASANTVGTVFTATGVGTGTGTAQYTSASFGIVQTAVFKSLNVDAITYKYAIFRFNIVEGELNTTTCESWNASTHVATNEAWTYHDCAPVGFKMDVTDFILFIHPRYLFAHSYIANEPTLWSGVIETAREDSLDTAAAGFPCWGWVSSTLWSIGALGISSVPLNGNAQSNPLICYPRTADQSTGINAAKGYAADLGITSWPSLLNSASGGGIGYYLGNATNKLQANGWDVTKRLMMPIKPVFNYAGANPVNYGPMYGLKVLSPAGNNMNKIKAPIDSNGNFSPSGTLSDHWLLNTHHKSATSDIGAFFASSWNKTDYTIPSTGSEYARSIAMVGGSYYMVTNGSTNRVIQTTLAGGVVQIHTGKTYNRLKYDGERYIYVICNEGVVRIDVTDNSTSFLAVGLSYGNDIVINGNYVYLIADYSNNTTPLVINRIYRDTFVLGTTVTTTFTGSNTNPYLLINIASADVDYQGNVYMVPINMNSSFPIITHQKIGKIITSGTFSILATLTENGTNTNYYQIAGIKVIDKDHIFAYYGSYTATSAGSLVKILDGTILSTSTFTVNTADYNAGLYQTSKAHIIKICGVVFVFSAVDAFAIQLALPTNTFTTVNPNTYSVTYNSQSGVTSNNTYTNTIATDGARIINTYANTGYRVWTNMNGNVQNGTTTLGQVALPV